VQAKGLELHDIAIDSTGKEIDLGSGTIWIADAIGSQSMN
jgi:hypothetical protein